MKNISALILAGGKSSRMGRDKALVCYQGKPMLKRVYEVAQECTQEVYILTPWCDRYKHILPSDCNYLTESQSGNGPLYGLYQGLKQISTQWILLLACDLPLLKTKIIQKWINDLEQVHEEILAVVPHNSVNWEPMCGFYRHHILPELQSLIQTGGHSFQECFSDIKVQALSITPEVKLMLHNCNTPEDLNKAF
ncbi:molybdenum cofactor guanylyltransferase [Calothrix rhizosoleniae]|uniref:molybdenum cofactor guanylyltransferase n=1 Tax=Calothrix rhizosoleniae TaxID=888997 RepID=UPI000B4A2939|nr:molybdenum cofactor guanylyltransferase [Calothrix rhizosoleniae]